MSSYFNQQKCKINSSIFVGFFQWKFSLSVIASAKTPKDFDHLKTNLPQPCFVQRAEDK